MSTFSNLPAAVLSYLAIALAPCFGSRLYFASGSNRVGEIRGLAASGCDFGVAVPEVMSKRGDSVEPLPAMYELVDAARFGVSVFVDSGAFSEVEFTAHGPTYPAPMLHVHWRRVFKAYRMAAEAYGPRAYVVAPDRVGCQRTTLERQARYRHEMQAVARLGATVLVPVQKGELDMPSFFEAECVTLGIDAAQIIPAIPMKKDATKLADLVDFVRTVRPARIHLLGLGPKRTRKNGGPSFADVVEAIAAVAPECEVICDSVLMASIAGRGNGRKVTGGRRALTVAMDVLAMQRAELKDDTARRALAITTLADMARPVAVPAVRVA